MNYFNKLPGFIRTPSGFEWVLLKKLPLISVASTLLSLAPIFYLYFSHPTLTPAQLKSVYVWLGVLFSAWFFIGAAAIGCVVVMIMKGPAYVADPYELPKENRTLEKLP